MKCGQNGCQMRVPCREHTFHGGCERLRRNRVFGKPTAHGKCDWFSDDEMDYLGWIFGDRESVGAVLIELEMSGFVLTRAKKENA